MKASTYVLISLAAISIVGCAAVRESDIRDTNPAMIQPQKGPVCLMRAPLPESVEHIDLGLIESYSRFYGSMDPILFALAEEARSIGANAVVRLDTRYKMGLIALARPFADGKAVRIAKITDFDCQKNGGELR